MQDKRRRSGAMSVEEAREVGSPSSFPTPLSNVRRYDSLPPHADTSLNVLQSAAFLNTAEFKNATREQKEELIARYQKRQQQNRNSQRNFRQRQAKLVEDLKSEIEKLRGENDRLMEEISALRKAEQRSGGCRDIASACKKERVMDGEIGEDGVDGET